MKTKQITFTELDSMSKEELLKMQSCYLSSSKIYKMIDYELRIRKIELPKYMKL